MSRAPDFDHIAAADGRYTAEAIRFVAEGLGRAASLVRPGRTSPSRHLSAAELVAGCVDLAAEQWSLLGPQVLGGFAISSAADIGYITFLLIECRVFTKEDDDEVEDFFVLPALESAITARVRQRLGLEPM